MCVCTKLVFEVDENLVRFKGQIQKLRPVLFPSVDHSQFLRPRKCFQQIFKVNKSLWNSWQSVHTFGCNFSFSLFPFPRQEGFILPALFRGALQFDKFHQNEQGTDCNITLVYFFTRSRIPKWYMDVGILYSEP